MYEVFKCFLVGVCFILGIIGIYQFGCGVEYLIQHSHLFEYALMGAVAATITTVIGGMIRWTWIESSYTPSQLSEPTKEVPTQDIPTVLVPIEEK